MMAAHFFVIRASSFFRHSSFVIVYLAFIQRAENLRFFCSDIFPDKDQFGAIGFKRFQRPAASHKIEKLRAVAKANEALRPDHVRGQGVCETFDTIAKEGSIGAERERFEL